jgi:hypothetical protein
LRNDNSVTFGDPTPLLPIPGSPTVGDVVTRALKLANSGPQTTWSVGLRYDLTDSVALKGQWDHIRTSGELGYYHGLFRDYTPEFTAQQQSVNVLSFTLDFLF